MPRNERPFKEQAAPDSEPPDGGYGWVVVAAVFWNNAHQWGLASAYGVFLSQYLSTSEIHGATPLRFAFIGGLILSQALAVAPVAANITRLFGVKITLLCGVLIETAALIGASFASNIWHLFLSQGICFGWGIGLQYISTVGIIPQWFLKRRGLASGIAAAGSGTGGLIYSLASNTMIQNIGVPWTYRILAIVAFVVNTICALLFRDRNKQVGAKPAAINLQLFRLLQYWFFLGWCFLSIIGFAILLFSLDDDARSIGLTAQQGSVVTALLNLGQAVGRPTVGLLSDIMGRLNVAAGATFVSSILCFFGWIFAKNYGSLLAVSLLLGSVFGTLWTISGPVAAEVLDLPNLPAGLTMMWLICAIPVTFSEVIALELRKTVGNVYIDTQLFAAATFLGAAIFMLGARTWKVAKIQTGVLHDVDQDRATVLPKQASWKLQTGKYVKLALKWEKV